LKEAAGILEVEEALVKDAIPVLEERGSIARDMIQGETAVYLHTFTGLKPMWLRDFMRLPDRSTDGFREYPESHGEMERRDGIRLNDEQREAVEKAAQSSVLVLTGGRHGKNDYSQDYAQGV